MSHNRNLHNSASYEQSPGLMNHSMPNQISQPFFFETGLEKSNNFSPLDGLLQPQREHSDQVP